MAARILKPGLASLLFLGCCFAQTPTARLRAGGEYEVAGTYTHVLTDGTFGRPLGLNGWTASATGTLLPLVQVTGEVGGYRRNGLSMYSFLAGPQAKLRIWRVQPFIRGLFGLTRVTGINEFSMAAGGGLDVPWTNHVSVRVLQCDYYRFFGGSFPKTDLLRAGIGITYSFGD